MVKVTYDPTVDALYIVIDEGTTPAEGVPVAENVTVDVNKDGQITGIEILNAAKIFGGDVIQKQNVVILK